MVRSLNPAITARQDQILLDSPRHPDGLQR